MLWYMSNMTIKINKSLLFVFATRPEFQRIKHTMIEFNRRGFHCSILYLSQKKNKDLEKICKEMDFINNRSIVLPKKPILLVQNLEIIEKAINEYSYDAIIISGDTTVAVATALTAQKLTIPLVKIGAGMRSGVFQLSEEKNDIITDHLAQLCICFSDHAKRNLQSEGYPFEKIAVSGTTLLSSVHQAILEKYKYLDHKTSVIVSFHRRETFQHKDYIWKFMRELVKKNINITVIIQSEHDDLKLPRSKYITRMRMINHATFLEKVAQARLIITDSNSIQEEACFLKTPCVTFSQQTNRPETVHVGANFLFTVNTPSDTAFIDRFNNAVYRALHSKAWEFPYGDFRKSSMVIINHILHLINK